MTKVLATLTVSMVGSIVGLSGSLATAQTSDLKALERKRAKINKTIQDMEKWKRTLSETELRGDKETVTPGTGRVRALQASLIMQQHSLKEWVMKKAKEPEKLAKTLNIQVKVWQKRVKAEEKKPKRLSAKEAARRRLDRSRGIDPGPTQRQKTITLLTKEIAWRKGILGYLAERRMPESEKWRADYLKGVRERALAEAKKSQKQEEHWRNHLVIGNTAAKFRRAIGEPDSINRTVTEHGVHEQWVYKKAKRCVYFENGILTSYQETK